MSDPEDTIETPEETIQETQEISEVTVKQKKPRTQKQLDSLAKARQRAYENRTQNADLKRKEIEIRKALDKKQRDERIAKIQKQFEDLDKDEEEEEEIPKRKRKPARRVIVTEASSASESEEDVEVVLPKPLRQPTHEQLVYERSMQKMLMYQ